VALKRGEFLVAQSQARAIEEERKKYNLYNVPLDAAAESVKAFVTKKVLERPRPVRAVADEIHNISGEPRRVQPLTTGTFREFGQGLLVISIAVLALGALALIMWMLR
jgi:hypothetical protein